MVKSSSLILLSCLVLLASTRLTTPHELLQSTFVYDPQNNFGNAFFRSFFGWQSVGALNECAGVFLPWTGSLALLWVLLFLSSINSNENYTDPFDLIYQEFFDTLLVTYNQQRCYFFTSVSELAFISSFLYGSLSSNSIMNSSVMQVALYVIGFYGVQLLLLNFLSFFMDFWGLITNNQPLARLGYMTGDFLKFFFTMYPLAY